MCQKNPLLLIYSSRENKKGIVVRKHFSTEPITHVSPHLIIKTNIKLLKIKINIWKMIISPNIPIQKSTINLHLSPLFSLSIRIHCVLIPQNEINPTIIKYIIICLHIVLTLYLNIEFFLHELILFLFNKSFRKT